MALRLGEWRRGTERSTAAGREQREQTEKKEYVIYLRERGEEKNAAETRKSV